MLSAESQIDVIFGLWNNNGLTCRRFSPFAKLRAHNLWASADRPKNRKTHLLDSRNGKSHHKMKSSEVPLNLVETRNGVQMRNEEMLNDGGIIRENELYAMLR